ncbi:MAG TPA: M28 family metallopeptidase [Gaiellaceae bacterium]|nr:M28 family metallopeptidase [Gaiellaceae bacterium]
MSHKAQVGFGRVRGQTPALAWRALFALALAGLALALAGSTDSATADRFNERRAFALLREQVELGPRPAGSPASRRLAERLKGLLPNGRFQPVPDGLRNVVGVVWGRNPRRTVVVGAHYDTKDIAGFVGANDGASGTATLVELARTIKPRQLRPTIVFVLFDGEESPKGTPDNEFERYGLRGSKVAVGAYRNAEAMILLDFVGDRNLTIPRERNSDRALWAKLRKAAARTGNARAFPPVASGAVLDDHVPFLRAGVPSIDLIDFDFACWHRACDDLSAVSAKSLDATGETVLELLRAL